MRIGELAQRVGVSTDTVRFYERAGWLPRASRKANYYRDYGEPDVEHLRLLIDLRRLDVPLDEAGQIAGWCHSGHCADATAALPGLIRGRRAEIADRIAGLQALDDRLAKLDRHLGRPRRSLDVLDAGGPCCDAAGAVTGSNAASGCPCCSPALAVAAQRLIKAASRAAGGGPPRRGGRWRAGGPRRRRRSRWPIDAQPRRARA